MSAVVTRRFGEETIQFVGKKVAVETTDNKVYNGTLAGIDEKLAAPVAVRMLEMEEIPLGFPDGCRDLLIPRTRGRRLGENHGAGITRARQADEWESSRMARPRDGSAAAPCW